MMAVALASPMAALDGNIAVQIELARPITGHNGPVQVIQLREPTLGDYIDCGSLTRQVALDPRVVGEARIEIIDDNAALMRWFVRLTGHGEAILRQLGSRDAWAVKKEIEQLARGFDQGNAPSGRPS